MPLDVVVLAAGLGKRMRSDLPKVLHPLAGRPLLAHVIDTARALAPRKIFVVHGHGADRVRAAFSDSGLDWVLQAPQRGTGHAVMQALPQVSPAADVLILYGDVPLVRVASLKRLLEGAREGLAILTTELADPSGYGRIVRDARRLLEAGVTLADPARIDVRGALECGRDVSIDVNCVFEGRVSLGDDVRVGPNCVLNAVNIGAGTITCNYDGAAKHRTVIEDDCFIGSDTTLVAPVRIARGSYIGAGSTISKDTPPGQLTVARARQVSIPSWKPPRKKG